MIMANLHRRLDTARQIAAAASAVAMAHFRHPLDVASKPDDSPVTIADQETEQAIRSALLDAFPGETIFGEEFGQTGTQDDMWIVDPIDGTRSFITGLPLFGMLLGYLSDGTPQLGVINMPALGELYAGARGSGATLNGTPITVSACRDLSSARLFLNEADRMAVDAPLQFARLVRAGALRRLGADCYPHALVASGHADAVVDYGLQPYDYLPVAAVVEAAGGVMTDWQGQPLTLYSDGRTLTAATPDLHADLLEMVQP
ncbi:inositol-phosphate phosphatase/L-galactose 1-phosphate phosphatase/histidinol-phosphatase [Roseovarius sp. MBR-154]